MEEKYHLFEAIRALTLLNLYDLIPCDSNQAISAPPYFHDITSVIASQKCGSSGHAYTVIFMQICFQVSMYDTPKRYEGHEGVTIHPLPIRFHDDPSNPTTTGIGDE